MPFNNNNSTNQRGDGINVVNSWNEWDSLQEVIVGSARGAADMGFEPALSPYFPPGSPSREFRGRVVDRSVVDDAERQLDNFANLLESLGVTVRRPDPVDHSSPVRTPDWELFGGHASACPRDVLLVIGDEIIEAPMAQRARYFEFRAYRSLLQDYFKRGARWTAAPKPLMTDQLYTDYARPKGEAFDFAAGPLLTESEPAFDAA
ncbi:MAG: amidinotransferase, partial [Acidobacteriota bacterium]|nr:amidinotransferase [Acidobacteriota bacterium]